MSPNESKAFFLGMVLTATLSANTILTTPHHLGGRLNLHRESPVPKKLLGNWKWIGAASAYSTYEPGRDPESLHFISKANGQIDLVIKKNKARFFISNVRFEPRGLKLLGDNRVVGNYLDSDGKAVTNGDLSYNHTGLRGKTEEGAFVDGLVSLKDCLSLSNIYLVCQSWTGDDFAGNIQVVFERELPKTPKITCYYCEDYQKLVKTKN